MKINIYDIIFWIFFMLSIIFFFWYLFGNSPTLEQALLVLIIGLLFKMQGSINSNKWEVKILKNSFIRLADDFKEHLINNKKH